MNTPPAPGPGDQGAGSPPHGALPDGFDEQASGIVRVFGEYDELVSRFRPSRFTDPRQGRLAITISPDLRRASWLGNDVLAALGMTRSASGAGRNADQDWQVLPIHLISQGITDLIVMHSEHLDRGTLTPLLLLGAQVGATVWLLGTPPRSDGHVALLNGWDPREITWEQFETRWQRLELFPPRGRTQGAESAGEAAGYDENGEVPTEPTEPTEPTTLPAADFLAFRSVCRERLPDGQFAWLDARLRGAADAAAAWARPVKDNLDTGEGTQLIGEYLRERYNRCGSLAQWIIEVRGFQIGLWHVGLFCQVDLPQVAGLAPRVPSSASRTAELWDGLRVYRQPVKPGVCALASLGLGTDDLRAVTIGGLSPGADQVTLPGGQLYDVEAGARVWLRALRLQRRAQGARDQDVLLADLSGDVLIERNIASILRSARMETGLLLTSARTSRKTPDGARWSVQWGISVQGLT